MVPNSPVSEIVCPYCGCKGKKTPHIRSMSVEEAKPFQWFDMRCGSCGRAFRSYKGWDIK